jgi:hypothetical protein
MLCIGLGEIKEMMLKLDLIFIYGVGQTLKWLLVLGKNNKLNCHRNSIVII